MKHHQLPEPQEDHRSLCTVSLSTPHWRCKIEIKCYAICQELLSNLPAALHNTGSLSECSNSQHQLTSYRCARGMQAAIKLTGETVLHSSGLCIKKCVKITMAINTNCILSCPNYILQLCFHLHSAISNQVFTWNVRRKPDSLFQQPFWGIKVCWMSLGDLWRHNKTFSLRPPPRRL